MRVGVEWVVRGELEGIEKEEVGEINWGYRKSNRDRNNNSKYSRDNNRGNKD